MRPLIAREEKSLRPVFILTIPLVLIAMLSLFPASWAGEKLQVTVSIPPQRYFVQRIGGDEVAVSVMVGPGASPATYEPKPRQMAALARSRIYFTIGVPFEKTWLPRIRAANPEIKIVRTEAGIEKIPLATHRSHGQEPEASDRPDEGHGVLDPHVWLSPPLVALQARRILTALSEADPAHADIFRANYRKFINDIVDLDTELLGLFAGRPGKGRFLVFHPAWGYFARAYSLTQVPIEVEGKSPKAAQVKDLIAQAKESGIRVIFVQPQFSAKEAEVIAQAISGRVVPLDPLAEDWLKNLRRVAAEFREVLR